MMLIKSFAFNDFQENTYILSDETSECVIIDPGCYSLSEKKMISDYIESMKLRPVKLLNTHCHIDHILGNKFIYDTYGLLPCIHRQDLIILQTAAVLGQNWGIRMEPSPEPKIFLDEEDSITFGNSKLDILHLPGHSPGNIGFLSENDRFIISGDVLFYEGIGRTDLPGGDLPVLLNSIRQKLFTLDENFVVYSGHGPATSIGHEKRKNPFLVSSFFNQN